MGPTTFHNQGTMAKNIETYHGWVFWWLITLLWAVSCATVADASNAQVSITTDVEIVCRLPENEFPNKFIQSLQIGRLLTLNATDMVIMATAVATQTFLGSHISTIFPDYLELKHSGSLDKGWLCLTIVNITHHVLGTYRCLLHKDYSDERNSTDLRIITLAKESAGTLHSYPSGFQIKITKKASVTCNEGCLCNKTFILDTCCNQKGIPDKPDWHCQTSQGEHVCVMSAECGEPKKRVDLTCSSSAQFLEDFECTQTVTPTEGKPSSPNISKPTTADISSKIDWIYYLSIFISVAITVVLGYVIVCLISFCLHKRMLHKNSESSEPNEAADEGADIPLHGFQVNIRPE